MKPASFVMSATVALLLLLKGTVAEAAELIVLSSNASRTAISELGPMFEKARGDKVAIQFANKPILKQQVEAGARFDVLIIEPDMLDDLTKQGKIVAGSRADVARVGMALLARAGAPKPDISTIEGFKNVLRNAESVAYTADGHSGTVFLRTLERLGLLEEMKPRLRPVVGRPVGPMVASGDVQMYAGPISTPLPGNVIVGRFPDEIQTYVGVSAGVSAGAARPDVARSFIAFLASPDARSVFAKMGFQQMPAQ
jgi:molybdate transport system substrate-binding protein